jgi:hypothetical protein
MVSMQYIGPASNVRALQQWENEIVATISQKKAQLIGNQEVAVLSTSDLGKKIDYYVLQELKDFPCSSNGSRFIHSTFTASPQLVIRYADLIPTLQPEREGSLFCEELGKKYDVDPLRNSLLGTFTQENTRLELEELRFVQNSLLVANDWTAKRVVDESDLAVVRRPKTIGEVDIDPDLRRIQLIATVRFGSFVAKDQEIIGETRDGLSLDLIIPLPHLSLHGKICPDGSVTLENEVRFSIDQLIGPDPVTWIDISHILNLQFDLRRGPA